MTAPDLIGVGVGFCSAGLRVTAAFRRDAELCRPGALCCTESLIREVLEVKRRSLPLSLLCSFCMGRVLLCSTLGLSALHSAPGLNRFQTLGLAAAAFIL